MRFSRASAPKCGATMTLPEAPVLDIPLRPEGSMTGSQFAVSIFRLPPGPARTQAIEQQLLLGNVPPFLRMLCPVTVSSTSLAGRKRTATYWVTPDYLSIGTDEDYLRIPLPGAAATRVADAFQGFLPTRRVVNDVYAAGDVQLGMPLLPSGILDRSVERLLQHNACVQVLLGGAAAFFGDLIVGHKKDVVLCQKLFEGHVPNAPGSVTTYGGCRVRGPALVPWSGLSSTDVAQDSSEYAHGVRLVAARVTVEGEEYTYDDLLTDPTQAGFLSDEGALPAARYPHVA